MPPHPPKKTPEAEPKPHKFTYKQQRFIDYYNGNATEAAIQAGYSAKTAYSIGEENLKKPDIARAIAERTKREDKIVIASRKERQKFWTDIFKNAAVDMRDRLKASELLGRSEADFTDRVINDGLDRLAEQFKRAEAKLKAEEESKA